MILPPVPSNSSSSSLSLGPLSLARTELSLDSPELAHRIIQSAFSTNQEKECHVGLESESEFKLDVPLVASSSSSASSTHDQSKSLPFISAFISAVDKLTRVGDLRLKSMQNNWVVPPESDALQSKRLPSIPLQSLLGVFAEDPAWRDELLVLSHIFIDRLNTHFQQKYSYFLSSFSIHRVTIASLKLAAENQETALHSSRWERFVSANELTRMLSQLKAHLPSEGFDPEEFQRHFAHLKALTLPPTSPAFPRPLTRMGARADSIDSAASTASHATFDCSFQLSVPSEEEEDDDMSEPPQMMSLTIKLSPHDNSMAFSTPSLSSLSGEGSLVTSSSRRRKPEPEEGREGEGEGEGDSEDEDKEYHVYVFGDASSVSTSHSHSHSHMQAQASGDHTTATTDTDMDEAIARHWYQMQIRALPPRKSKSKNKTQKKHKSSRGAGSVTSYSSADADSAEHMSTGSFSVASFPLTSPAAGAHFASPSFSFSLAAPRPLPIPMSASMAMQSSEFARLRDMSMNMNMGSLGMGSLGMGMGFGLSRFSSGAASSSSSSASVAPLPIPPASSIAMSRYDIAKDLASRHSF